MSEKPEADLNLKKIDMLRMILALAEKVITDEGRDNREKQRWSRIAIEAINTFGKMKDVGPVKDDLANLIEKLKRETENGKTKKEQET